MKKILLFLFACLTSACLYANTCTYDGVHVSLFSESVSCVNGQALMCVSVSKTNINMVRCQVECKGSRKWVDIPIYNGEGCYDLSAVFPMTEGVAYRIKLVAGAGMCY